MGSAQPVDGPLPRCCSGPALLGRGGVVWCKPAVQRLEDVSQRRWVQWSGERAERGWRRVWTPRALGASVRGRMITSCGEREAAWFRDERIRESGYGITTCRAWWGL